MLSHTGMAGERRKKNTKNHEVRGTNTYSQNRKSQSPTQKHTKTQKKTETHKQRLSHIGAVGEKDHAQKHKIRNTNTLIQTNKNKRTHTDTYKQRLS